MTITPQIRAAITRFDKACHEMAWKGAAHPEEHAAIEREHAAARDNLERQIEKVVAHSTMVRA